ncbi:hypothetical protein [Streptomyces sp. WG5]|uniref:hypothetical protein n=1 Tax=Streptomyces sp. WG5 TaxID=3417648 RepID=UPI003CEF165C
MLAWIMALIMTLVFVSGITGMSTTPAPSTAQYAADNISDDDEWESFHSEAYAEHSEAFTALFNGYETRWAKNGRLMIRNGDSGPYKFVKRGQ